jgi:hypothetical protein
MPYQATNTYHNQGAFALQQYQLEILQYQAIIHKLSPDIYGRLAMTKKIFAMGRQILYAYQSSFSTDSLHRLCDMHAHPSYISQWPDSLPASRARNKIAATNTEY